MRGRKPKPTKLKLLEGNPGKRKLNKREPEPAPGVPTCPDFLSGRAREEWARISVELDRLGLLTDLDMAPLGAYCCCFARWAEAEAWISEHGTTAVLRSDKGAVTKLMLAPQVSVAFQALREMRLLAGELGLSPSSRSHLQVEPPARGVDPIEQLMYGD